MADPNGIRVRVTNVLVHCLGVEAGDIDPSATLLGDLGAESIDFLDIGFRLEHEFKIKIPRGELFIEPTWQGDAERGEGGLATDRSLHSLRSQMPYADSGDLERYWRHCNISDLFTVDLIVRYIEWKLGRGDGIGARRKTVIDAPDMPRG